mmetsp:Transcript_23236/g.58626  ORF Transcript_23236/g.58626 Transcript_23236/m.58626 type:complete len:335 (-) Transcript_23236:22-1026(-)
MLRARQPRRAHQRRAYARGARQGGRPGGGAGAAPPGGAAAVVHQRRGPPGRRRRVCGAGGPAARRRGALHGAPAGAAAGADGGPAAAGPAVGDLGLCAAGGAAAAGAGAAGPRGAQPPAAGHLAAGQLAAGPAAGQQAHRGLCAAGGCGIGRHAAPVPAGGHQLARLPAQIWAARRAGGRHGAGQDAAGHRHLRRRHTREHAEGRRRQAGAALPDHLPPHAGGALGSGDRALPGQGRRAPPAVLRGHRRRARAPARGVAGRRLQRHHHELRDLPRGRRLAGAVPLAVRHPGRGAHHQERQDQGLPSRQAAHRQAPAAPVRNAHPERRAGAVEHL